MGSQGNTLSCINDLMSHFPDLALAVSIHWQSTYTVEKVNGVGALFEINVCIVIQYMNMHCDEHLKLKLFCYTIILHDNIKLYFHKTKYYKPVFSLKASDLSCHPRCTLVLDVIQSRHVCFTVSTLRPPDDFLQDSTQANTWLTGRGSYTYKACRIMWLLLLVLCLSRLHMYIPRGLQPARPDSPSNKLQRSDQTGTAGNLSNIQVPECTWSIVVHM